MTDVPRRRWILCEHTAYAATENSTPSQTSSAKTECAPNVVKTIIVSWHIWIADEAFYVIPNFQLLFTHFRCHNIDLRLNSVHL